MMMATMNDGAENNNNRSGDVAGSVPKRARVRPLSFGSGDGGGCGNGPAPMSP